MLHSARVPVVLACLLIGCSPTDDPDGSTMGAGGSAGTGGAPPAPPRGAAHVRVKSCLSAYSGIGSESVSGSGIGVPDVPISQTPSNNTGGLVPDGTVSESYGGTYEVDCRVTGDGFLNVEAMLAGPNTSPAAADPGSPANVSLTGTIDTASGIGSGRVSFYNSSSLDVTTSDGTACELSASPLPLHVCSDTNCTGDSREPGETGKIWLQFECLDVQTGAVIAPSGGCEADGTIVMERCKVAP